MKKFLFIGIITLGSLGTVDGQNLVCIPSYTLDCVASPFYIDSVKTLNAFVNFASLGTDCNTQDKNYIDYLNKIVKEYAGNNFQLHVGLNPSSPAWLCVWVDWDNDTFLSQGEQVYLPTGTLTSATFTVNVPVNAVLDTLVMRVRIGDVGPAVCDSINAGETEDYRILVLDGSSSGIANSHYEANWTLFPNPATDHVAIQVKQGQMCFVLTDLLGNILMNDESKNGNCIFDLSELSHGMYFIKDQTGGTIKFIH